MSGNKKNIIMVMIITLMSLLLILGATYAILIFDFYGITNQKLIVGNIYMKYNETNQLTLNNMIPSSTYNVNDYFEFTISGKNEYQKKDIYYEVQLSKGAAHETRTTRIRDDLLKFTLVEIKDDIEKVVVDGVSFNELNNTRLWVNTITKSTDEDINIKYRLYAWISDNIKIGNTQSADYDADTWNDDIFASINVGVYGDLVEKNVYHDLRISKTINKENKEVSLAFETNSPLKEIHVADKTGNVVNLCQLENISGVYTCELKIETTGNYRVYGVTTDGEITPVQTVEVIFDDEGPNFNIYDVDKKKINNGDIVDYEMTDSSVMLNTTISNISDKLNQIKSIKYSFENINSEPNYIDVDATKTSFEINKQVNTVGIYELIIVIEDQMGNITKKIVNYRVYTELDESDMSMFIIDLEYTETIYDGTEKRPNVTLKTNNVELIQGTDYGVTYTNNTNAGVATVTITGIGNYGGTFVRTFNILKATSTVTLSNQNDNIYGGRTTVFNVQADVSGTYTLTSVDESIATVTPSTITATANSSNEITVMGEGNGTTIIKVLFTPNNSNYNSVEKNFVITSNLIRYVVVHERLANDGETYVVVEENEYYGKLGEVVSPLPNTYINYSTPQVQQLTLTENEENNIITYQYTRECYGATCEYCEVGSQLGACMYNEADSLGLYTSGLGIDTIKQTKRVIGTKTNEPDNYVCFGTTTDCTNVNYLHRIVSVTRTDHRVEIIYPQSMGTTYWLSSSYTGDTESFAYDESYIKNKVDAILTSSTYGYATNINSTTKWSDIIVETEKSSFANTSVHTTTTSSMLTREELTGHEKSFTAKLHLISLSDLLMSTGSSTLKFSTDYESIATSWMFLGANEWTYHVFNTGRAYLIGGTGTDSGKLCSNSGSSYQSYCSLSGYFSSNYKHNYRASFELNKDTLFCGGSGTSDDPIILGYGSCE